MEYRVCPYEGRCKFAHGTAELLSNQQANNKYKTKMCENYNKKGCCLYGARCNFIHQDASKVQNKNREEISIELGVIKLSSRGRSRLLLLLSGDRV